MQSTFSWWPREITFQPFIDIWSTVPLAHYFLNSLVVSTFATVCRVMVAIFASYAVCRYRFRGRGAFSGVVLSTQMFPGILFLLPLFLIFVNIDRTLGIHLSVPDVARPHRHVPHLHAAVRDLDARELHRRHSP